MMSDNKDTELQIIKNKEFGGERPLYKLRNAILDNVTIHLGESSIKETSNIYAQNCTFEGKYVFWECHKFRVTDSLFRESARSSLWYSSDVELKNCKVEAPKMFRRMQGIKIDNCHFSNAEETLWDCNDVVIKNTRIENADYLGMHTNNVHIENYHQEGNYAFQYSKNVTIKNSILNSKDALWESENVTIIDSEINGEYLAWYSKKLRLIRCHITGEQPLCYCENLIMEDCTMGDDANLAFEYSSIQANIHGNVHSVKNPTSGSIIADSIGEIIIDENQKSPANCKISVRNI